MGGCGLGDQHEYHGSTLGYVIASPVNIAKGQLCVAEPGVIRHWYADEREPYPYLYQSLLKCGCMVLSIENLPQMASHNAQI